MIFALGAMSVGLLFLLLLPAVSRRAMRLARRRLEMLLPLSMEEVIAERDLLRAEFAAERRRLEQRMEVQADEHAVELAELGRRATEIVTLQDQLAKLQAELNPAGRVFGVPIGLVACKKEQIGILQPEIVDDFRPQGKQSVELVRKFSHVLVGCTFQGIAKPALENQMSGTHDCELYTRC